MSEGNARDQRGLDVMATWAGSPEGRKAMQELFARRGALGSVALGTAAGQIWARSELSKRDRSLVVISFLTALARQEELRHHIAGGLNHGLTRDEIDEILLQCAVYAGVPFALAGAALAEQVFAALDGTEGRAAPPAPLESKPDEKRRADGLDVLKTLIGDPNLDTKATEQAILASNGFMGELVMDYAFGDVWSRPQLSRRDRSLVVISVLAALNLKHELEIHLGGALNHGVTREEIEEVTVTLVIYGGFPRAIDAQLLARQVFAARDATA